MLVDLEQTARALEGQGGFKVNQGGGLPAAVRSRLAKLRPALAGDPFQPPDRVALDYSLLCASKGARDLGIAAESGGLATSVTAAFSAEPLVDDRVADSEPGLPGDLHAVLPFGQLSRPSQESTRTMARKKTGDWKATCSPARRASAWSRFAEAEDAMHGICSVLSARRVGDRVSSHRDWRFAIRRLRRPQVLFASRVPTRGCRHPIKASGRGGSIVRGAVRGHGSAETGARRPMTGCSRANPRPRASAPPNPRRATRHHATRPTGTQCLRPERQADDELGPPPRPPAPRMDRPPAPLHPAPPPGQAQA